MNSFIKKEDSKCLYGIAILLMIFHHCFLDPARLKHAYISSWGKWAGIETRLAWQGKLCVAIFAFISGYALAQWSLSQKEISMLDRYKKSLGQLMKLYQQFWLVFAIFVPAGVLLSGWNVSLQLILNGLFYGEAYCGEWWYVRQYLRLMLNFPVLDFLCCFFDKKGFLHLKEEKNRILLIVGILVATFVVILRLFFWQSIAAKVFIWGGNHFSSLLWLGLNNYDKIFIVAYLISRYRIYELLAKRKVNLLVSIAGIIAVYVFRYFYVTNPAQSNCDVYLTPFLIFFVVNMLHILHENSMVKRVLAYLGYYSTFMWLTHSFFLYHYFQWLILLPRYSLLIYIWAVIVSLGTAIVLSWVNKKMMIGLKGLFGRIRLVASNF